MNLLDFEHSLILTLESPLILEGAPHKDDAIKSLLDSGQISQAAYNALSNIKTKEEYDQVGLDNDKRYVFNSMRYRYNQSLAEIAKIRRKASECGLDSEVKEQFIMALGGQKRWAEITKYATQEQVDQAIELEEQAGKFGPPGNIDKKAKDRRINILQLLGHLTSDEAEAVRMRLVHEIKPKIEQQNRAIHKERRGDDRLEEIISGTDIHQDLRIKYDDVVGNGINDTPVERELELLKSTLLSDRLSMFEQAITQVAPEIRKDIESKFKDVYGRVLKALTVAMPDDAKKNQRIYTAAQYALYNVAPELDKKYRADRAEAEEHRIQKQKEQEADALKKAAKDPTQITPEVIAMASELGERIPLINIMTPEYQKLLRAALHRIGKTGATVTEVKSLMLYDKLGEKIFDIPIEQAQPIIAASRKFVQAKNDEAKKREADKAEEAKKKAAEKAEEGRKRAEEARKKAAEALAAKQATATPKFKASQRVVFKHEGGTSNGRILGVKDDMYDIQVGVGDNAKVVHGIKPEDIKPISPKQPEVDTPDDSIPDDSIPDDDTPGDISDSSTSPTDQEAIMGGSFDAYKERLDSIFNTNNKQQDSPSELDEQSKQVLNKPFNEWNSEDLKLFKNIAAQVGITINFKNPIPSIKAVADAYNISLSSK